MTADNMQNIMEESGITKQDLMNIHNEIVNAPPAPPVQTESV